MAFNYEFMRVISSQYDAIKKSFQLNMSNLKTNFSEDEFQDTFLKCCETYKDDNTDIKKMKAYFWTAFKTNTLNKKERSKHFEDIDSLVDFDIIDDEYVGEIDEFVEIAKKELYSEFGKEISDLWLKHVEKDIPYDEIEKESCIQNIHYQFKKIRKYIREELSKKNIRFKELLGVLR